MEITIPEKMFSILIWGPGDMSLLESMMASSLTFRWITRWQCITSFCTRLNQQIHCHYNGFLSRIYLQYLHIFLQWRLGLLGRWYCLTLYVLDCVLRKNTLTFVFCIWNGLIHVSSRIFKQWLVNCSVLSHYHYKCRLFVNWIARNKLWWNLS